MAMKVAIVAFNNLKYSPYVRTYADYLDKNGISYDVIYPNREGFAESLGKKTYAIPWDKNKNKAINFLKFRAEAIRLLKKSRYDFVFVLTTMPAVLLSGFLSRRYKGKYLVDVRDYTYENIKLYALVEKRALKNSAMNVISSPGFRKFLPDAEYCLCHNISAAYRDGERRAFAPKKDGPIVIGYVGSIAYKTQCIRLIHLVENDNRFCFYFYGSEGADEKIASYLKENPCERIKTFGAYKPEEKVGIMQNVDILFNVYGYGNKLLDYALSNKLYDSFYMGIPVLTSPNTAMSEELAEFSFDIDLLNEKSLDALYDWYHSIDAQSFASYANQYLENVFASQDSFYEALHNALFQNM